MSREGEPNSARGLADILREAGISSTGAGGRRRRRDHSDSAAEADPNSDVGGAGTEAEQTNGIAAGSAAGSGALSAYLRSSAAAPPAASSRGTPPAPQPGPVLPLHRRAPTPAPAPTPTAARTTTPPTPAPIRTTPPPRTDTGPLPTDGWTGLRTGAPDAAATSTIAGSSAGQAGAATGSRAAEAAATLASAHANRSPSPLATAAPEDPEEDAAVPLSSGTLSWAILVVELLAAVGLGVAAWYAFSALWDLLPYVAAFAGPLVVTGLVAVAGALRARTGRNPLGLPTLCILVFAGTVLVVLPAATLIVP